MKQKVLLALMAFLVFGGAAVYAHQGDHEHAKSPETSQVKTVTVPSQEERTRKYFTDLPVLNQEGEELRFFSDVLKDHVVLVSMFYTRCMGLCPLLTSKLAKVQELLGDEMGKTFFLVSLSLDPDNDTPEVLTDYAKKFGAKPGWSFLTGKKEHLKLIIRRFGETSTDITDHNGLMLLGNVPAAHWQKLPPMASPQLIAVRLRMLAGYPLVP